MLFIDRVSRFSSLASKCCKMCLLSGHQNSRLRSGCKTFFSDKDCISLFLDVSDWENIMIYFRIISKNYADSFMSKYSSKCIKLNIRTTLYLQLNVAQERDTWSMLLFFSF